MACGEAVLLSHRARTPYRMNELPLNPTPNGLMLIKPPGSKICSENSGRRDDGSAMLQAM